MLKLVLEVLFFTALAVVSPSFQAKCYGNLDQAQFPHCVELLDGAYALHWAVGNDSVTFGIEVDQVDGWFSLGLSQGGGMRGADIWTLMKDGAASNWTVKDTFSTDYAMPVEDALQDITVVSTKQTASSTVAVISRTLDTCDLAADQVIYPNYSQPYIVAFGDKWGYHGPQNRETRFLILDNPQTGMPSNAAAAPAASEKTISYLMPNLTVPPNETSYLCTNFKAPSDKKYQIIFTDYSITPSKLVHHMLLYACYRKPDIPLGEIYECGATPAECSALYLPWAPGAATFPTPLSTGFPFGKGSYEYFMVQVHYTNPEGKTGVKDSSGFITTYTSDLRPNDLGVMWLGAERFEIPAKQEAYTITPNICPSECTSRFTTDLNLVMSDFHMHQTGANQTVQRLRKESQLANGAATGAMQEIVPFNYRDYYDFYWQGGAFILPGGEKLMRGEAVITTCTYNTLKRPNVTYSGLSSYDEMCYNFITYWPAQKIDRCITFTGSEVNGTALAGCANQQDFFNYFDQANFTEFNEEVVMDMIQKGLVVAYNTSQYKNFVPYNRTTPECAAQLSSRATATPPAPGAAPANRTSSAGAIVGQGWKQVAMAVATAVALTATLA